MPRRSSEKKSSSRAVRWGSRSRSRGRRNSNNEQQEDYEQRQDGGMMMNSTVTGATGNSNNSYSYTTTTQPAVTTKKSSSLTGNISSLFRRGSGRDTQPKLQASSSNASSNYKPPPQGIKETIDSPPVTFLENAGSAGNAAIIQQTQQRSTSSGGQRLFYSNADDDDDDDSQDSSFEQQSSKGGGASSSSKKNQQPRHSYGRYHQQQQHRAASPSTIQNQNSTMGSSTDADDTNTYDTSTYGGGDTYTYTTTTGDYTGGTDSISYDPSSTQKKGGKKKGGKHPSNNSNAASQNNSTTILRYRGFSTSIKSLFLDEALVCASMGCFGLILSNRTEYLLQLRNDRRGVQWGRSSSRRTLPSRIVAYALLLTLLLIGITFVIWGFGDSNQSNPFAANNWYNSATTANSSGGSGSGSGNAYDDAVQAYQDDAVQAYNDDNGGNNNNNNDDGNANYNNNNDDDDGNAANDDGGNYNNNYNDDGGNYNNYNNNDDGNNNANYYNNNGYQNNGYVADDQVNNYNYNNGNVDDQYYQNNGYQQAANDDGGYNNNNGNDDQYYQNNGYQQAANDDGGYNNGYNYNSNNGNVDDQYYQNNGYQQAAGGNDDAGYNNGYNYNGYNNYYNGGGNDDYANNNNNGYYYNNNYNNGGRRHRRAERHLDAAKKTTLSVTVDPTAQQQQQQYSHSVNGVFKLRDMKEGVWEPVMDFLSDEWYRPYELKQQQQQQKMHGVRALEDGYYYGDDGAYNNDSGEATHRRDLAADLRVAFIIAFLIVLGVLGRRRRMRTRYYLVRARAQEDHLFYASSGTGIKRVGFQDSREDQYEGACSHTLCGCYPVDPPREGDEIDDEVQVSDEGVSQRKKKPRNEDCVGRGFNCLLGLCCGFVCKCWFQCLSICALAQEAREIRLLVPTRFQRVDYITHQPFHEYQKDVNDLRKGWLGKSRKKSGIMIHFNALSRLSRYILTLSIFCLVIITCTLLFNPRASFSWPDAVILLATFLQSFLVLWIVHWIFHKSDLSLDAVIKMFAAGFVIAVPSSFFFEGLLVNITLVSAYIVYGIGQMISGDAFVNWVVEHYRILWILGEVFNAYVVAAVTEELCKYYTFRCVEHPDLIFLTGLTSNAQDERALEGGVVKYPFSSHQVQRTNQRTPYDDEASQYSRGSHRSKASKSTRLDPDELDDEMFVAEEQDVRTYRQKAAAVTTAMISVAVGLACAENFLYVFLLGGTSGGSSGDPDSAGGYMEEWIVLLFRSIFPVHALAAAMQSVNMIRKFVETDDANGHRIGVGRIILPAVIMHGSFDAILLGINVFIETSWDDYLEKNAGVYDPENPPYNPVLVNGVAWFSIILVMLLGVGWYFRENRSQRLRLKLLEEQEKAKESGSPTYTSPGPHSSEVELV